jgi:hypothetical protein
MGVVSGVFIDGDSNNKALSPWSLWGLKAT